MKQLNSKVRFKTVAKLILLKEFSKGWEMSECFEGSEKASGRWGGFLTAKRKTETETQAEIERHGGLVLQKGKQHEQNPGGRKRRPVGKQQVTLTGTKNREALGYEIPGTLILQAWVLP